MKKKRKYYERLLNDLRIMAASCKREVDKEVCERAARAIVELMDEEFDTRHCPYDLQCIPLNTARRLAVDTADLLVNHRREPQQEVRIFVKATEETTE